LEPPLKPEIRTGFRDPEAMRAVNDAITACWGHLLGKTWQGPDFFINLAKQSVDFRVCAVGFQSHQILVQLFVKGKQTSSYHGVNDRKDHWMNLVLQMRSDRHTPWLQLF